MLHLIDFAAVFNLSIVIFVDNLDCPVPEFGQNGQVVKFLLDLQLKLVERNHFSLCAVDGRFLSGAVIVGIFFHLTSLLYKFAFGFCGVKTTTLTAANKSRKGKGMLLWSGFALPTEEYLDLVKFFQSDHRFVFSFKLHAFVFKNACVENVGEDTINPTSGERLITNFLALSGAITPVFIGNFENLGWCICSRQHQLPHFAYQVESFRIFHNRFLNLVVQIPRRSEVR